MLAWFHLLIHHVVGHVKIGKDVLSQHPLLLLWMMRIIIQEKRFDYIAKTLFTHRVLFSAEKPLYERRFTTLLKKCIIIYEVIKKFMLKNLANRPYGRFHRRLNPLFCTFATVTLTLPHRGEDEPSLSNFVYTACAKEYKEMYINMLYYAIYT